MSGALRSVGRSWLGARGQEGGQRPRGYLPRLRGQWSLLGARTHGVRGRGYGLGARGKGQEARGKGQGSRVKGQGARSKGQGARGKGLRVR